MKSLRLVLIAGEPPQSQGSAVGRWLCFLLRSLAARGHQVTALCACSNRAEAEDAKARLHEPRVKLECFPTPVRGRLGSKIATLRKPYSYTFSPAMEHALREELRQGYDILHLEGTFSGWLGRDCPRSILNVHNLYAEDWSRQGCRTLTQKLRRSTIVRTERQLIRGFSSLLTVSSALAGRVAEIAPRSTIHAVPLSLDAGGYDFIPRSRRPLRPVIGLIGSMDWPPSLFAAERLLQRLWPQIKRCVPAARLQITGRNARRALGAYIDQPDVEIRENVPSTQPYFEAASILLYAPEAGTGMKVKVLEAFASGVPVVATPAGIEGLRAENGLHASIHETDRDLIDGALRLLRDEDAQERQRIAARRLFETQYGPDQVMGCLEGAYAAVLGTQSSKSGSQDTMASR